MLGSPIISTKFLADFVWFTVALPLKFTFLISDTCFPRFSLLSFPRDLVFGILECLIGSVSATCWFFSNFWPYYFLVWGTLLSPTKTYLVAPSNGLIAFGCTCLNNRPWPIQSNLRMWGFPFHPLRIICNILIGIHFLHIFIGASLIVVSISPTHGA